MSLPSGVGLCEPSELYNLITQCSDRPAVLQETHLLLIDARHALAYNDSHIILAKHAKKDAEGRYRVPFGVYLPTCTNCIVYDSNTVSDLEDAPAVHLAHVLSNGGSKNVAKILKGGYERFSAEYPFLRTQKILYSAIETDKLPHYASEVVPLFLYLGDERHANNTSMNYDMKIHVHLNISEKIESLHVGAIQELRIEALEDPPTNLLPRFNEICNFLESHRTKSERVLIFSEMGLSGGAAVCIAYLMKRNHWPLKVAFSYIKACRPHIQPTKAFMVQLQQWEDQISISTNGRSLSEH